MQYPLEPARLTWLAHAPLPLLLVIALIMGGAADRLVPPLASANATTTALSAARSQADQRAVERTSAAAAAASLAGPRGDFEQRGSLLNNLSPAERSRAARELASDARLIAAVAAAAAAERSALRAYDQALMARTRDLGPAAELLRSATWPIVEQLKLYPPPLGQQTDWLPPDAVFFVQQASLLETDDLATQVQAAIAIGRSTYSIRQLQELDAIYRRELDRYAQALDRQIHQPAPRSSPGWLGLALVVALLLGGVALVAAVLRAGLQPGWALASLLAALGLWYLPQTLWLAGAGAVALVAGAAWRPDLALLLPLIGVPLYYRPRLLGSLSFPLNETLIGLLGLGLLLRAGWEYRRAGQAFSVRMRQALWAERWLLLAGGILIGSAALSMLAPGLTNQRAAVRELRRTLIEPWIWALLTMILLRSRRISPQALILALVVPAGLVAINGVISFAFGRGVWITGGTARLIGLLPSSTALAAYLGAALAAALACWSGPGAERRMLALLSLPLGLAVFLTYTRGAWLGVAAAVIVGLVARRAWRLLGGGLSLAGAASLGLWLLAPERLALVLRLDEETGAARIEIWQAAVRAIQSAPLLGLGLDQFAHVDAQRFGIPQLRFLTIAHPHNLILESWLHLGLAGLLAVVGLTAWAGWRLWRARQQPWSLAALATLVALTIHGMLDQTLLGGDLIYIWWMVGMLAATADPTIRSDP